MRRLVETLRERIAQFVLQRDDLALVIKCSDADAALVSNIVSSLDEQSSSELFWVVVDEFQDPVSFVESCVRTFAIKHQAACLVLEREGQAPLPPLPEPISDPNRLQPLPRLRQLIVFSRSLLPTLAGCGVVWGFLPMKISDGAGYSQFMSPLWKHDLPFPWCHHVRMFVRDMFPDSVLAKVAESAPRVKTLEVDFSTEKIQAALENEAGDEQVPLAERINCSLMLAGIDHSHGRFERAIQQYELVHRFAAATDNPTLAAVALNGMGEAYRLQGKLDQAGDLFHAAVAPAAQSPAPPVPVLFNLYLNLGELRLDQQRWQEAEVFLQGAADFALLLRDPAQRLRCWLMLGDAQLQQGNCAAALKTWSDGAIVAGRLERNEDYAAMVDRLNQHFAGQPDGSGLAAIMREIEVGIAASGEPLGASNPHVSSPGA